MKLYSQPELCLELNYTADLILALWSFMHHQVGKAATLLEILTY